MCAARPPPEVLAYLVKVVLFVKLALHLSVDGQPQEEGILFARGSGRIHLILAQGISERVDELGRIVHLF